MTTKIMIPDPEQETGYREFLATDDELVDDMINEEDQTFNYENEIYTIKEINTNEDPRVIWLIKE